MSVPFARLAGLPPGRRPTRTPLYNEGIHSTEAVTVNWIIKLIALAIAIIALVFAVLAFRWSRDAREDIRHLERIGKPIGFSAWKNTTQEIDNATSTTVQDWTTEGGIPAYDDTDGAFNATSGVFTVATNAKYSVTGSVCFDSSVGGVREGRLVTSGVVATVFDQVGWDSTNTTAFQCLAVSQIMDLTIGDMVWLEAFHTSGAASELVNERSRFSLERIAQHS